MANLILASKREVKSGNTMWHAYRLSDNTRSEDFYFASPLKCLRYLFLLRKRSGGIIPKGVYSKLMAEVSAGREQAPAESAQEQESPIAKRYEEMKAKHSDALLLFRLGDFYTAFADDAKVLSEVCGITLTRTESKNITAQQAAFPAESLDTWLPKLVRAGKRVAICDEAESAPKKKATRKSTKKESK